MNDHIRAEWPELPRRAPADITIVGLGAGDIEEISLGSWRALTSAQQLWLRTDRHPCVTQLARYVTFASFDSLYEQYDNFDDLNSAICQRVVALGRKPSGVTYAVPGHPWVGEATTGRIVAAAERANLTVQIIGATSFVAPSLAAMGVDLMQGGQVIDAMNLAQQRHPVVEVALPLLVGQVHAQWLASDLKSTLQNAYPASHPVHVIQAAGTDQQRVHALLLCELDHLNGFDHLTSLYVPPLEQHSSFSELQELVAHLRAEDGCPWDQAQTLESLCKDLLGECAEVLEAIDAERGGADNGDHIAEELGDLISVATMMVQIATDERRFQMADVVHQIVTKLIRRHPHVFGTKELAGVGEVVASWDEIKRAEKAEKGITDLHPLDGVPVQLPALEKARVYQAKATKAGLVDRTELAAALPELQRTLLANTSGETMAHKIGEMLWLLVALAHTYDVNAEDALRTYVMAFRRGHATGVSSD